MYRKVCSDKRQHRPDNRMWSIGIERKVTARQIRDLRKAISQISLLAILVSLGAFLFLSVRFVSDIRNYNVCLSTKVSEESSY